ncbi:MAG: hypothetical protein H7X84_11590 [Verrucomicrobia bacterium]|nr:hypothetical protein [Prolixibacteraceae bacterium]
MSATMLCATAIKKQWYSEDLKPATKTPMHQISPSLNCSFGEVWCIGVLVAD